VPWNIARIDEVNCVKPPLQADFAKRRFAYRVADARKLDVEGIKSQEMRTRRLGCEKACKKPVLVAFADEIEAVAMRLLLGRRGPLLGSSAGRGRCLGRRNRHRLRARSEQDQHRRSDEDRGIGADEHTPDHCEIEAPDDLAAEDIERQ
jgi:hypothetical protein